MNVGNRATVPRMKNDQGARLVESRPGESGEWGRAMRERREAAGLSQAELARRAGISEGTIKRIENAGHQPSRDTLLRLLAVPELRLQEVQIPDVLGAGNVAPGFIPNCWIAPGFNALDQLHEMLRELNGQGGHIDQTHLFLDHISAAGWHALATQASFVPARTAMPLDRAAVEIMNSGGSGYDVIALGPGDGRDEVRLALHLLDAPRPSDLSLFLLDISQPLLSVAFEHATEVLAGRKGVSVTAVQGNFHHLPRYRQLLHMSRRSHRRRLVAMLGYTFTNLLNEPLFIRNSLGGFGPGDLMLLNVGLACAPADRPDEIRKKDPRLSGRLPLSLSRFQGDVYHEWLIGPIRRYVKDVKDITITTELDVASCPVPGSYAAVVRAKVALADGDTRTFSVIYLKRYDEEKFVDCFRREGWDPVAGWHYGTGHPSLLYLFRKR